MLRIGPIIYESWINSAMSFRSSLRRGSKFLRQRIPDLRQVVIQPIGFARSRMDSSLDLFDRGLPEQVRSLRIDENRARVTSRCVAQQNDCKGLSASASTRCLIMRHSPDFHEIRYIRRDGWIVLREPQPPCAAYNAKSD